MKQPNAFTLADIFWAKLENDYDIDVDDFVYEIISEFDFEISDEDTDEADAMRDEVLSVLRFKGFNKDSQLDQDKLFDLGSSFEYDDLLAIAHKSLS